MTVLQLKKGDNRFFAAWYNPFFCSLLKAWCFRWLLAYDIHNATINQISHHLYHAACDRCLKHLYTDVYPPTSFSSLGTLLSSHESKQKKGINYREWDVPASTVMCQDIKINVPTVCKENVILVAVKYQFILSQKHFETFQSSSCLLLMSTFLLRSYSQFTWWLYLQSFSKDRILLRHRTGILYSVICQESCQTQHLKLVCILKEKQFTFIRAMLMNNCKPTWQCISISNMILGQFRAIQASNVGYAI